MYRKKNKEKKKTVPYAGVWNGNHTVMKFKLKLSLGRSVIWILYQASDI